MTRPGSSLTVEEILAGTSLGRPQSVGLMGVVPLLADPHAAEDDFFSPPDLEVGTRGYGTVVVRNRDERPTILPTGAGWVVEEAAQDHAVGGGALLPAKSERHIDTAACVQQNQGGLIKTAARDMLVLPHALRTRALATRRDRDFRKLWDGIAALNRSTVPGSGAHAGGNLVVFLKQFDKELAEFVAEFEAVPHQVGALVIVGGRLVGIERAPSVAFWERVFVPLVRVCYGSRAVEVMRHEGRVDSGLRSQLGVREQTLAGLRAALREAAEESSRLARGFLDAVSTARLKVAESVDDQLGDGDADLVTVAGEVGGEHARMVAGPIAGQVVRRGGRVVYASVVASV